jgi:hypothetical protein
VVQQLNRSTTTDGVYFLSQLNAQEFVHASKEIFPNSVWKMDVLPDVLTKCVSFL